MRGCHGHMPHALVLMWGAWQGFAAAQLHLQGGLAGRLWRLRLAGPLSLLLTCFLGVHVAMQGVQGTEADHQDPVQAGRARGDAQGVQVRGRTYSYAIQYSNNSFKLIS